jgi:type IV secretory pathway VirB4 component
VLLKDEKGRWTTIKNFATVRKSATIQEEAEKRVENYMKKKEEEASKKRGRPPKSADKAVSDGSTASYYELPEYATELQHLISHKNMNAQIGEIFRASYRYGEASHSDQLRDAKKIKFYIDAEIKRLGG